MFDNGTKIIICILSEHLTEFLKGKNTSNANYFIV